MKPVEVKLDTVPKHRNSKEWRPLPRATCEEFGLEVTGDGHLVKKMVSLLHENKCQISRVLRVTRGDTLVFKEVPLKSWLFPEDKRPEWLKGEKG